MQRTNARRSDYLEADLIDMDPVGTRRTTRVNFGPSSPACRSALYCEGRYISHGISIVRRRSRLISARSLTRLVGKKKGWHEKRQRGLDKRDTREKKKIPFGPTGCNRYLVMRSRGLSAGKRVYILCYRRGMFELARANACIRCTRVYTRTWNNTRRVEYFGNGRARTGSLQIILLFHSSQCLLIK